MILRCGPNFYPLPVPYPPGLKRGKRKAGFPIAQREGGELSGRDSLYSPMGIGSSNSGGFPTRLAEGRAQTGGAPPYPPGGLAVRLAPCGRRLKSTWERAHMRLKGRGSPVKFALKAEAKQRVSRLFFVYLPWYGRISARRAPLPYPLP